MNRFGLRSIALVIASVLLSTSCKSTTADDEDTGSDPEWQTVFFDDFNRSNGPIGSNYSVLLYDPSTKSMGYDVSVTNNRVELPGEVFLSVRYVNPVTSDISRVSAKFSTLAAPSGNSSFGVSAKSRYIGDDQSMVEGYFGFVGEGTMRISEISAGSSGNLVALVSKTYDLQEGRWYRVELTVNGADLSLVVTDLASGATETLTVTDVGSLPTGNAVGLNGMLGAGDILAFDDFLIEELI